MVRVQKDYPFYGWVRLELDGHVIDVHVTELPVLIEQLSALTTERPSRRIGS